MQLETFTPIAGRPTHGYSGPIGISTFRTELGLGKQVLNVAKEYDPDRPQVDDSNDYQTPNAYSVCFFLFLAKSPDGLTYFFP